MHFKEFQLSLDICHTNYWDPTLVSRVLQPGASSDSSFGVDFTRIHSSPPSHVLERSLGQVSPEMDAWA